MPRHRTATVDTFRDHRDADAAHKRRMRRSVRDIAPIPKVVNPKRRAKSEGSLRFHLETYHPETYRLAWSDDHLKAIKRIEDAVLRGGLFALAMPRGSGKSSMAEGGGEWALLHGHRGFICLIGSDEGAAEQMLESIKTELETNDLLHEDFPEVCYPIRALEGIAHRAHGQLCDGGRTHIGWTGDEIVLPTIEGSKASGGIIRVRGITGRLRGMKFKRPDGRSVRPDLVILDDPQTDESARSPSQCAYREAVLSGAILGLAGPGKKIAGVMPCTVVRPGDMADRILNRDLHPEWKGERTKLVYAWPSNEKLWEQYREIRIEAQRNEENTDAATRFYTEHRAAMDAGAKVAWPQRFNPDELSAVQHVMNLRMDRGEEAFAAEYQNEPILDETRRSDDPTAETIAARCNGVPHATVPLAAHRVTAFVDVQQCALFPTVCAWEDNFTGYVIDYGTWPDQGRSYYTKRDIRRTMTLAMQEAGVPKAGFAAVLTHALGQLVGQLATKAWPREDGTMARISRIIIDANWGEFTEVVYNFCQRSPHAGILTPWHGKFIGGSTAPMAQWQKKRGDRVGHHWKIPVAAGRQVRHCIADVNYWKSFIMRLLSTPIGDPGALTLWGHAKEQRHRLFGEHCAAEYRIPVEGRGRKVDEWKMRPEGFDNEYFDGLVGCAVGASMEGLAVADGIGAGGPPRARLRLSDLAKTRGARTEPQPEDSTPESPKLAEPEPAVQAPAPSQRPGRMKLSDLRKLRR